MKRVLLMSVVASVVLLWFSNTAEATFGRRACVGCSTVACTTCDPCDVSCDPCDATPVSYFPATRFYRTNWGNRGFSRPAFTGYRGRFVSYGSGCCW
ncbi:MAG TPA: hypothetical protein VMY42_20395 [Thermoguttaceae bacterium]|nr:hypothetical protein [Thermoguttaceae bacterium]